MPWESRNHGMVWVGKFPKDHLVPSPCHGQGHFPLENLPDPGTLLRTDITLKLDCSLNQDNALALHSASERGGKRILWNQGMLLKQLLLTLSKREEIWLWLIDICKLHSHNHAERKHGQKVHRETAQRKMGEGRETKMTWFCFQANFTSL